MRNTQGVEPDGALVLASARSRGTPRTMYMVNLWFLTWLGDLVGRPVDLFALPTPLELGLPEAGSYSLQLASSADRLAMELVYESNPLELIVAMGGVQTLIAGGVVAAVAIPAYTEYRLEAQVAVALASVRRLQHELLVFRMEKQRFPSEAEAAELLARLSLPGNLALQVEPDGGIITVELDIDGLEGGNLLMLIPEEGDVGLDWLCSGNLDRKYLENSNVCAR
jgi:hypothetical protein